LFQFRASITLDRSVNNPWYNLKGTMRVAVGAGEANEGRDGASTIPEREPYHYLTSGSQWFIYTSFAKVICLGCIAGVSEVAFRVFNANGPKRPTDCLK
jgi:hypothetical protein